MWMESHPYDYPIAKYFPERRAFSGFEGGGLWLAEKDGGYYVIIDEGSMADFLIPGEDDDLLNELVKIHEFDSELERQQFIQEIGWTNKALE
jgi:hypothetical protein